MATQNGNQNIILQNLCSGRCFSYISAAISTKNKELCGFCAEMCMGGFFILFKKKKSSQVACGTQIQLSTVIQKSVRWMIPPGWPCSFIKRTGVIFFFNRKSSVFLKFILWLWYMIYLYFPEANSLEVKSMTFLERVQIAQAVVLYSMLASRNL